ncbi:MAG TPA: TetR family transcriptional regulator [Candidatus Angelobacter sp.]|nr:TetR family transcriptional regulator [Candidatus Angelobacter sp.]
MPRVADQLLEAKIAQAAHRLWRVRGAKGLTLRSVARAAGTTTTTVYKRFHNKDALLLALAELVQTKITAVTTSAATIEEAYRRFLRFAEEHPHEYKLLWGPAWSDVLGPGRPRPIKAWLLDKFAARFGGQAAEYIRAYYALFLLIHGTANLLSVSRSRRAKAEMRSNCLAICDALVGDIGVLKLASARPKKNYRAQARRTT